MICANKPRIQMVDDFLTEGGYLFKKSIHSDDECMFLIYEDAVNQAVLLFELTINDNTTNAEMLCSVVAFFPRFNLEKVINECEKLSFIHHPFEFYVVDESVNSVCEFEVKTNKDRVICVVSPCKLDFYYQPVRTNDRLWLMQTPFSGSVFAYFRDQGRNMSLTIAEVYSFKSYKSPKLSHLFSRLPSAIEYVIKYEGEQILEAPIMKSLYNTSFEKILKQSSYVNYDDRAA